MNAELRAPGDRYRVAIDVTGAAGGDQAIRRCVEHGVPFWDVGGPVRSEAGAALPHSYMVVVDDVCSLVLVPGENGLTVRCVRLLNASQALIRARVMAGSGAPDWLPPESEYLIFDGDPTAAVAFKEQFIPLAGMAADRSWAHGETPLDLLAIAVGKSVARANATLARVQAEGGVALVSTVTVRVAVNQAELARGRVLLSLARPGEGQTGQFVELIMTTVPGAAPEGEGVVAGAIGPGAGPTGPGAGPTDPGAGPTGPSPTSGATGPGAGPTGPSPTSGATGPGAGRSGPTGPSPTSGATGPGAGRSGPTGPPAGPSAPGPGGLNPARVAEVGRRILFSAAPRPVGGQGSAPPPPTSGV